MWVAPMMRTRAGGTMACTNTSPSGVSSSSLSPLSKRWRIGGVGAAVVAAEQLVPAVGEAGAHDEARAGWCGRRGRA